MKQDIHKKGPSQRQLRVGEQIRHILAETLQRGHFSHANLLDAGKVSISEVRIAPDLKNASAYIIVRGNAEIENILQALNEEARTFQKEISRKANLKFTPRLEFRLDKSFDQAGRIEALLHEIHMEDKKRQG